MSKPVPLVRRFTEVTRAYLDHDMEFDAIWSSIGRSEPVEWATLRDLYRAVILADAGAGKTFELRAEAERLAKRQPAFFIRIENIDAEFGDAFEVGTPESFQAWLAGTGEAWFFLDSVDEVRLEAPRAFEAALRAFAARIHDARQRAHVYISSRPYAWRPKLDGALIEELLPYAPPLAEVTETQESASCAKRGRRVAREEDEDSGNVLPVYRLAPLDRDDIRIFSGHRGLSDPGAFLDALERTGLFRQAQLPFDLEDMLAIWQETGSLESRLDVLEHGLRRRLTPPLGRLGAIPRDKAMAGARRLALAATLTGDTNIQMPGERDDGLQASLVLADWPQPQVRELLGRGVFSDAIYEMVRFRHRESRELLAAQRLAEMLKQLGGRSLVEGLIFQRVYGEEVIVPRLRPLLPWLILLDTEIRDRALRLAPELATEGGDAARLPLEVRQSILLQITERIAREEARGGDNSEIARIAQLDLEPETTRLIEKHQADDNVIFFLGRLAWQGKMPQAAEMLAPIARDSSRGIYARIVSVRAVAAILGKDVCHALWKDLNAATEVLPRRLLAELVEDASADALSVNLLLDSLARVEPHERFDPSGLSRAIHGLIDRLPVTNHLAPEQPIARLVEGLAELLAQQPYIERRECRISEANRWLMWPALHAIERMVVSRLQASLKEPAITILGQLPALRDYGYLHDDDREYRSKLHELIPRWATLNDRLFWHTVTTARASRAPDEKPLIDDWDVTWVGHLWAFDATSFDRSLSWISARDLPDDRSVALNRSFRTYVLGGRPRTWRRRLWRAVKDDTDLSAKLRLLMRPPRAAKRQRWRQRDRRWERQYRERENREAADRAALVTRLKANPDLARAHPEVRPGQMSWDQAELLWTIQGSNTRISRGADFAWRELIPEFGEAVAEAFRDGAIQQWRAYNPVLRSDGDGGTSIPGTLIFAMTGLEIEAGQDHKGLNALSREEAIHAMRYVPRELNGYPAWFESLYHVYPQEGFDLIWGETRWELANSSNDQPMHYMLQGLIYNAPWLHARIAPFLLDWLSEHGAATLDCLRHSRRIMVSGGLSGEALGALAARRAQDAATSDEQLPYWYAMWVDAAPDEGVPALVEKLAKLSPEQGKQFAETFVVSLVGGRHGDGGAPVGTWRAPVHLKTLYLLMFEHIRISEDINRMGGGSYSPTVRDDAQDARGQIFSYLADIPGEASYREILALADEHPEPSYRIFMRQRARRRATEDSDRSWSVADLLSMEGNLSNPLAN